jgi:hypothetical protein
MNENKDEAGERRRGADAGPKRPFATIEGEATEVARSGATADSPAAPERSGTEQAAHGGSEREQAQSRAGRAEPLNGVGAKLLYARTAAGRLGASLAGAINDVWPGNFFSHLAAGVAGAILTLLVAGYLAPQQGSDAARAGGTTAELAERIAAVEQAVREQSSSLPRDLSATLAKAETRLARLEEAARAVSGAQAQLASETKALKERLAAQELPKDLASRVAKLEQTLANLSAAPAGERKNEQVQRGDGELAALKSDSQRLGQRLEGLQGELARSDQAARRIQQELLNVRGALEALKGDVEGRLKGAAKPADIAAAIEPLAAKIAALEQDVQAIARSDEERAANARRSALLLELSGLKRAVDRGQGFATELAGVRKLAGDQLNLAALEPYAHEGVPTLAELMQNFRSVANSILDAETEAGETSVLDRLLAGARSIVRVRKVAPGAEDTSPESVVGRMEMALKEGRLADVLSEGKKLTPKAAGAAADWLKKVEARHAVDQAIADVEGALKGSLAAGGAASKGTR